MQRQLKPATLNALKGNNLTAENQWLGQCVEDRTQLIFEIAGEPDGIEGILIGMSAYHYLVLAKSIAAGLQAKAKERVVNKAWVSQIYQAK